MCIQESHEQDEQENHDLHETGYSDLSDRDRPWIHKDKLHIEDEEDECIQIIPDIELIPGSTSGWDTTLIGLPFLCIFCSLYKDAGDGNTPGRKCNPGNK